MEGNVAPKMYSTDDYLGLYYRVQHYPCRLMSNLFDIIANHW